MRVAPSDTCVYCHTPTVPDPLGRAGGRWRFCPVCEPTMLVTARRPDPRGAPSRPGRL